MSASAPPLRVLCIDDDEDILALLRLALERTIGAEVALFHSGDEALEAIAAGLIADVILLDINLAGEDGREVARRLAEQPGPPVPLIIVSAGGVAATEGAIGYITKPFDPMLIGDQILTQLAEAERNGDPGETGEDTGR